MLTVKQKAFADYYIESGNATEAAIKAGYSKNSARQIGADNLSKHDVKTYINERLGALQSKRVASQQEVLEYLTSVMRGEINEECVVVEGDGDGVSSARVVEKQVTPKDRNKAAEMLAKRYGLMVEKQEISGSLVIFSGDDALED